MVNAAGIISIRAEDTEMESVCAGENAEQWLRASEKDSKREEIWEMSMSVSVCFVPSPEQTRPEHDYEQQIIFISRTRNILTQMEPGGKLELISLELIYKTLIFGFYR